MISNHKQMVSFSNSIICYSMTYYLYNCEISLKRSHSKISHNHKTNPTVLYFVSMLQHNVDWMAMCETFTKPHNMGYISKHKWYVSVDNDYFKYTESM